MTKTVYVAGALNADNAIKYIMNLRRMIKHSIILREHGYAVFVPGLDILLLLLTDKGNYNFVFYNSWHFIKLVDAVYVVPKSGKSKGTKREIKLAKKLGIPIFRKVDEMDEYFMMNDNKKKKKNKLRKLLNMKEK